MPRPYEGHQPGRARHRLGRQWATFDFETCFSLNHPVRTYVVSGPASGIGPAPAALLTTAGDRVIGVDLRGSDVDAALSTSAGRSEAVRRVAELAPDGISGVVPCAGLAGLTGVDPALLVSVNF